MEKARQYPALMFPSVKTIPAAMAGALFAAVSATSGQAQITEGKLLPSGLVVSPPDVRLEPDGVPTQSVQTVRLRYVSDQLADSAFGFEDIEGDFAHLCETDGLMTRTRSAPKARQIIISIASEPLNFGEISPEIIQYFDAFDVVSDSCVWAG